MPIGVGGMGVRAVVPQAIETIELGNGKWIRLVYFDRFGHTDAPDETTLNVVVNEGFES